MAEEYILDTMVALDGSRVHCVKRLVSGLPLGKGWEHQALLAEVRGKGLGAPGTAGRGVDGVMNGESFDCTKVF